jgi:hypothetical protein
MAEWGFSRSGLRNQLERRLAGVTSRPDKRIPRVLLSGLDDG